MEQTKLLLYSYLRLTQRMSRQFRDYFDQPELTMPQMLVITALSEDGTMPISQLARYIGSANSTVSGIVDRLEKMGLVERIRSEEDRRVIYVCLTEKYRAGKKADSTVSAFLARKLSGLSEQEVNDIRASLEKLDGVLKRAEERG